MGVASTIELRPGLTLSRGHNDWWIHLEDGRRVRASHDPKSALLLLERDPNGPIREAVKDFPLTSLLVAALESRSPHWIERALAWAAVSTNLARLKPALDSAFSALPKGEQRTRQHIKALRNRSRHEEVATPDSRPDQLTLDVQRYGVSHTVPILREANGGTHAFGSGVVISISERWFILTAGHVIADLRGSSFVVGAPLREDKDPLEVQTQTTLGLAFPSTGIIAVDADTDAGVIEVVPRDERAASELRRAEVPIDAVCAVTTVDPTEWKECNVTLTGYPGALAGSIAEAVHGVFAYTTGVAGDPPLRPVPPFLRKQVPDSLLALWTAHDDVRSSFHEPGSPGELPDLGGASGGGYWAILLRPTAEAVIYLVATHCGSAVVGDESFMWGTPIGFHLRTIAELAPELRGEIHRQWPRIDGYNVRPALY